MLLKILVIFLVVNFVAESDGRNVNECNGDSPQKKIFCYYLFHPHHHPHSTPKILEISHLPCTHVIFAFATLNFESKITIESNEVQQPIKSLVRKLKDKNPCVKILIGLGGWNEGSEKFSVLAESLELSEKFANDLMKFLIFYGFDGIDFHWMYPTKRGGIKEDTKNFLNLLKLTKQKLENRKKFVVAALGAKIEQIEEIYSENLSELCKVLDFVLLMTYDFNEKTRTGFSGLLYGVGGDSVTSSVERVIKSCDKEKIVVGISTFGKAYNLEKSFKRKVGDRGRFVEDVEYHKICLALKNNSQLYTENHKNHQNLKKIQKPENEIIWKIEEFSNFGKFAYNSVYGDWISYEDHHGIAVKANFVNEQSLGGLMFYTLNGDDLHESCGPHLPLISTAEKCFKDQIECREIVEKFKNRDFK